MSHQLQNTPADWLLDFERNRRIVDGLRALGIILVIAFHGAAFLVRDLPRPGMTRFMDSIPAVLNVVWQSLGSEIVFLTSGFLLCYLLIREYRRRGSIDVRDFWIRRASRIVPLFLIAFLIFLPTRSFRLDQVLANLFFVAKITGHRNYIPVGWSLEVMVQVYAVLPFVVLAAIKSRVPLIFGAALVVGSVALRYFALAADPVAYTTPFWKLAYGTSAPQLQKDLYYLTWFRLTPFMIGLCAAVLVTEHRARLAWWFASRLRSAVTLAVGLALMIAGGWLPIHDGDSFVYDVFSDRAWLWFWTAQRATVGIGVIAIMISCFHARGLAAGLLSRFLALRQFGPISSGIYSIYLFHIVMLIPAAALVFFTVRRETITEASLWQYLAIVGIGTWLSVKLSTFLSHKVEAPVQAWLRRPTQAM